MAQRIYTIGVQYKDGRIDTAYFICSTKAIAETAYKTVLENNTTHRFVWLSWSEPDEYGMYSVFHRIEEHEFAPLTDPKDIYWD